MNAPIVPSSLSQDIVFTVSQCLIEGAIAIEGEHRQHTLCPAMNGVDGRFIHPVSRPFKTNSCTLACLGIGVLCNQIQSELIFRFSAPKDLCTLCKVLANTITQLKGCCISKGNYENLWWQ